MYTVKDGSFAENTYQEWDSGLKGAAMYTIKVGSYNMHTYQGGQWDPDISQGLKRVAMNTYLPREQK